ncbi:MAG: type II toxin-antitoxin system VapC family toxin [Micrococcales bacterium]|nr:type II toxin-antitoxin system VapC family toxin [Micrococcales bacterium]
MTYLIDTCVLSELTKDPVSDRVERWFASQPADELVISVVSVGEIVHGIEKKAPGKKRDALVDWFENELLPCFSGRVVDIDTATMRRWGSLRATGRTLPIIDSLVAASALTVGATLVTRNTAGFAGIDGLDIINPWTDQTT